MRNPQFDGLETGLRAALDPTTPVAFQPHPEVVGQGELSLSDFVDSRLLPLPESAPPAYKVALPEQYEPGYAYPLIVWLHQAGGDENDIDRILPAISERNQLGLGIRGPLTNGDAAGFRWPDWEDYVGQALADVKAAVLETTREFNVHSERIYIAGAGAGGTLALRMLLRRPAWFAGAVNWQGELPQEERLLRHYRELTGKSALLVSSFNPNTGFDDEQTAFGRLLHHAGLHVQTRAARPGRLEAKSLRCIDHWIMNSLSQFACVL